MAEKKIVLLHGWGAKKQKLAPLAKSLQDRGWQTLNLALPGFDQAPPEEVWGVADYAEYAQQKAEKKFGGDFFVFGHSFGGKIAFRMGLADSQDQIKGLVLCAVAGFSRPHWLKRTVFLVLAKIGKALVSWLPGQEKFWRRLFYRAVGEHDYQRTSGMMRKIFKKVVTDDLRSCTAQLKKPLLLLWGREDQMTPVRDMHFIKKKLPTAKTVIFQKADHLLPYRQPDELAVEIEKWFTSQY